MKEIVFLFTHALYNSQKIIIVYQMIITKFKSVFDLSVTYENVKLKYYSSPGPNN